MKFTQLLTSIAITLGLSSSVLAEPTSMWKVSKGNEHVYVGGTVHILPPSEFPLPSQFQAVYEKVDNIVLEANLPAPDDQQAQFSMLQSLSYEPGKTLSSQLSSETHKRLKDYFAPMGVNVAELDRFRPGFIVSNMVMMEAMRFKMAGEGVDQYFKNKATSDGKKLEFLETMEFQLQMLAGLGEGEEDRLINSTIDYMPNFKQQLESTIEAWRTGDGDTLKAMLLDKMKKESPKSFEAMMTSRNKNWVPLIEKMFNDGDKELVLVGVAHLVGEDNVLQLLEQKGYQVSQIDSSPQI